MTNSKTTRKALLSSALALTMCVAMLIATTFAWFTDTASTAVNKIQAGTLDVELVEPEQVNEKWVPLGSEALKWVKATEGKGEDVLWEPGCTYNLESFRIKNNGDLKLKYKVIISGLVGNAELLKAIDFTVAVDGTGLVAKDGKSKVSTVADLNNFEGTLDAEAVTGKITITGEMKTEAGNQYQGLSIDGIGITVVATQMTGEYDSEGSNYDALAEYPVYTVKDVNVKNTYDEQTGVITETKVETETTIKSNEKVSADEGAAPLATATISAGTILELGATQVKLVVKDSTADTNVTIESTQAKKTLEVKLEGVSSENKVPATVSFYIESGLADLKLYHTTNGVAKEMTKKDKETNVQKDQDYFYNFDTGKVTMMSATFSPFTYVYDATVATASELAAVTNDDKKTVTISSAKLLAGFAQSVNNGHSYGGYTITLTNDIDLSGREWTPIELAGSNGKIITFDGQGHTVSNFKVTAATGKRYSGLFGTANFTTIKGLNVDNATVKGYGHVGAIVGHGMVTKLENCKVTNSKLTAATWWTNEEKYDDGDKVGALIGWTDEGINEIKNCTVDGCTVEAYRDVGGLVGYVGTTGGTGQVVTGNTVKDTEVIQNLTNGYESTTPTTVRGIVGRWGDGFNLDTTSNTATNVSITTIPKE